MATYSSEGIARYYGKEEARKRIHGGRTIVWDATLLKRPQACSYRDDDAGNRFKSNYFRSIRSNYLALRDENAFIIEHYSPHRFSRQFNSFPDSPGLLGQDIREASLENGIENLHEFACLLDPWQRRH